MNQTAPAPERQPRQTKAPPVPAVPDAMMSYAEAAGAMLWSVETVTAMLDLNYTLLSLGGEVVRRQQEAMVLAVQRALRAPSAPDSAASGDIFMEFARLNCVQFERHGFRRWGSLS